MPMFVRFLSLIGFAFSVTLVFVALTLQSKSSFFICTGGAVVIMLAVVWLVRFAS